MERGGVSRWGEARKKREKREKLGSPFLLVSAGCLRWKEAAASDC